MLKIHQIKCSLSQNINADMIAAKLNCRTDDILSWTIERESLDARRSSCVYSYTVRAQLKDEKKYLHMHDVAPAAEEPWIMPDTADVKKFRPVIAGFGPAGMFAALVLAEAGMCPIVIERGAPVAERQKDVERFLQEGILNPESNVQYGEGGAGTFSDGKLTTRIKDTRIQKVLQEFIEAGAPEAIAWQAHPHLGTDQLSLIVEKIRKKIESLGGEVRFHTRLEELQMNADAISGAVTDQGIIPTDTLILCIGHSAYETCRHIMAQGIEMQQKEFAVGVRVEHPQEMIDRNQYKNFYGNPRLPAAEYHLACKTSNGRGVYSFCMCPGGVVIPSASDRHTIAVNGMSYSQRAGKSANSAILVQVKTSDFDHGSPLDGYIFQHNLEKQAYAVSDSYAAPAQNIRDYMRSVKSRELVLNSTYAHKTVFYDFHQTFSDQWHASMKEGLKKFDAEIPGFIDRGIMEGMETRSSSPVRILRQDSGISVSADGLFPCGEGAGYSGGIVSSAVDGIRQAENAINAHREKSDR